MLPSGLRHLTVYQVFAGSNPVIRATFLSLWSLTDVVTSDIQPRLLVSDEFHTGSCDFESYR
jgi:hypothetical protein